MVVCKSSLSAIFLPNSQLGSGDEKQIKQRVISSIEFPKRVQLSSVQGDDHCDICENCVQREQREGSDFLELSGKA